MNNDNNAGYYERRAEQALELAGRATSAAIRDIHLNMASRYAAMNKEQAAGRPILSMAIPRR